MVDTQIFGYPIPKETDIFLDSSAASFVLPAFAIDDRDRSESARWANDDQAWDPTDIGDDKPERWLRKVQMREVFDARAGPMMAFGVTPVLLWPQARLC